jgi:hypothetical protein
LDFDGKAFGELDSRIRKKLIERGYTAKELETLKRTGKHSFEMRRQDIHKLLLAKGPWTEEETEILEKMREDRKYPRVIAHRLARNEASVRVKSNIFRSTSKNATKHHCMKVHKLFHQNSRVPSSDLDWRQYGKD